MNPSRRPINWTQEKLSILRSYYPTMFNKALARWLGCSVRTLIRKANEMGLRKVDNFNRVRAYDISLILSEAVKRSYAEGRKTTQFLKGVRNNPDGEFRPGFKFSGAIEEARVDKIRQTFRRKKLLKNYGL